MHTATATDTFATLSPAAVEAVKAAVVARKSWSSWCAIQSGVRKSTHTCDMARVGRSMDNWHAKRDAAFALGATMEHIDAAMGLTDAAMSLAA